MAGKPFLSVMIPVYNGEKYIADAIESVLNQPCRDLEVVILNDGSTDKTLKIAERYRDADPRVSVQSHPNYGIGRNRNEGFPLLNGTCAIFLDDDDVLVPGFYTERTKDVISRLFESGVETIVPSRLHANEELTGCYLMRVPMEGVFPGNGEASLNLPYEFTTIIYRRDVIERNGIRFSNGFPEMESIFRHKCVFCSQKVLFTNDFRFIVRRDNPTQLTKVWNVPQVVRVRAEQYAKLVEWHRERGTQGAVMEEMEKRAREAQTELDNFQMPHVSPIQRLKEKANAKKQYKAWEAGMEPLGTYFYAGSPDGEKNLDAGLDQMLELAGLS